jgi:hypothetical protein
MQVAPATATSVIVAITGVLQDPSTYSVSGTTLTFSQAPPTGTSNISVRYMGIPASGVTTTAYRTVTDFTATAGQTTFSVPSYTVGYIDVYRNGVRLAAADYTATNGTTVVLVNAATLGDSVVTESFYVSSVLNAISATAGAVNTTYLADNSVTTAKIAPGAVVQADLATNVAGTGPAFSAYFSGNPGLSANTATKIAYNTEVFDTNSNFDTTNNRFTPTVAGYYLVTVMAKIYTGTSQASFAKTIYIYKNGSNYKEAQFDGYFAYSNNNHTMSITSLVYCNGSTDYIEGYALIGVAGNLIGGATTGNTFEAHLARSAT